MLGSAAWRLLFVVSCGFALGGAAVAGDECMKFFPEVGKALAVPCGGDEPSAPSKNEAPAAPSRSETTAAPPPAASGGRQCIKYIPAVDINVAVECEELVQAAPAPRPPASPAPAEAGPPPKVSVPATKTYPLTAIKRQLAAMTTALTEAKADTAFRESFCTMHVAGKIMHREEVKKDRDEVNRLVKQHEAHEAKVGDRGRWVYTALQEETMAGVLGTAVDDGIPSTRLRQTPEGQAFLEARDSLQQTMSCNCMYDKPTGRLFCCDSCNQEALKARF